MMKDKNLPNAGNTMMAGDVIVEITNLKEDRMFIWDKDAYRRVLYSELLWLEAARNYCCLYLQDQPKLCVANPLLVFEKMLPPGRFTRVHRGGMVNLEHVDRVRGNTIYIGKHEIPLGQPYRESFLACFNFLGSVKGLRK